MSTQWLSLPTVSARRCHRGFAVLAVLVGCLCAGSASADGDVPRIIFDSDMSSDWDDVGDIAVLHGLASLGKCEIIGMMASSQNGGTPTCMDAINTYYGKPDIPIGVRPDILGAGSYPAQIASAYEHDLEVATAPHAADLYRQLLAASPDKSVTIVTTGYLNNIQALLASGPDQYSSLSGVDLVKQKVKVWACAGGSFPQGDEFNFRVEPTAAHEAITNWPTAVTYTPFHVGQPIKTGGSLPDAPEDDPIRRVYVDIKKQYPHPSWGQIALYQTVCGTEDLWNEVTVGSNNVDPDGHNYWTPLPDPSGPDDQKYLTEVTRAPVRELLDSLIMLRPNDGSPTRPGDPANLRTTAVGSDRMDLTWFDGAFNESGFVVERMTNGTYQPIATLGANVTTFSDTGLASVANSAYRVKAFNDEGESIYANAWYYSGWTEISDVDPGGQPLYTYYNQSNLRWARGGDFRPNHITLNNDSNHGQNLSINVEVGALGAEGSFFVYFFYGDQDNWYRLKFDGSECAFEKQVEGTLAQIGEAASMPNIGNGTDLKEWRIDVTDEGLLVFVQEGVTILSVSDVLTFEGGLIGLGGKARVPVWQNFHFETSQIPEPGSMSLFAVGGLLALISRRRKMTRSDA